MRRLLPFVAGSALGVPLGIALLGWASPAYVRMAVGLLLILFSLYTLFRPTVPQFRGVRPAADASIGVLNGVVGGATALAGIALVIWAGLRGWPRDEQRAVFQPVGVATFLMIALWLGGMGSVSADTARLFAIGLPALLAGTAAGWWLYGRLDEVAFRKVVLVLLLISGGVLAFPAR